jgi:maleylpyruvate isomerase
METRFPHLDETVVATARYLDALTVLPDDQVRAPSVLPGWTRAHVITHLSRNADALAKALDGALSGEVRAMYSSQEQRDADIEAGADRSAAELRDDAVASAGRWHRSADELHASHLDALFSRVPGGPTWPVSRAGAMRRIEVEVHHADLGAGYTAENWPTDLLADLMARRRSELAASGPALEWFATDTGERWSAGEGPLVTGRAADLVWWLLGRGSGEHLQSTHGALPQLGRWA